MTETGNADLISQHYGRYIVDPTTGLGSNDQPNNSRSVWTHSCNGLQQQVELQLAYSHHSDM